MQPIASRMSWDRDGFPVRADFSVEWDGPPELRLYAQDAARHMRGIADPTLNLMAWRGAIIANSLLGRQGSNANAESSASRLAGTPCPAPLLSLTGSIS